MLFSQLKLDMLCEHQVSGLQYHVYQLGTDHATLNNISCLRLEHVEPDHPILQYLEPNGLLV